MHLGLKKGHIVSHNLIPVLGSPVPLLKFQTTPRLLMSSGSKKKELRYVCQSEAEASHLHRMWAEVHPLLHTSYIREY